MAALDEIKASAAEGKLVVVTGAGVSIALASPSTPSPSWVKLIASGIDFAATKGRIDTSQQSKWSELIKSSDLDDLLMAAEFVSKKLGGRAGLLFSKWMDHEFSSLKIKTTGMSVTLKEISSSGVLICTLNYDKLIERATNLPTINMKEPRKAMGWARREERGVLHLHGVWDVPETCILGISDYSETTNDDFRANLQRALSTFNRILFIGCGDTFEDPNFSALIRWVKLTVGSAGVQHYALVRNDSVAEKHKDELWQGFIEPIGFGDDHAELPRFISDNITAHLSNGAPIKHRKGRTAEDAVITSYRHFLLRDCGQMTIEGVRADADTAKQKFDIEKLFVPLQIQAVPPEFSPNDSESDIKLKKWFEEFEKPLSFGHALAKYDRMALLALPGGGKTLLLKRLAVAYADPERRTITDDSLPDIDILPILIRCREWRDHIRLSLSTMIDQIGIITGQPELAGLFVAAKTRFKQGRILLLIDGLDEIHNDADRTIFVDNLEEFLKYFPKIRLVVTSREAGFALIAPCLVRFCTRWRIAPLSAESISLLCTYWHHLMGGATQQMQDEISSVSSTLIENHALRRLAENPLLLTMLLVVKHGYGRLPPDRVSLYERAVEVLLDTWNIKGHNALSPREAVPQLAYVAYRMLRSGKQTATERELLELIEECRQRVPLVKLYAKDTPDQFLKRVELRSSLLLEAGRVLENSRTVPFYQFRHLTFQEYLASVAVVEGHYDDYEQGNSPLSPLKNDLLADEWKEVIPMAAVLAKKQADAILAELTRQGGVIEREFLLSKHDSDEFEWSTDYRMPAPIARLAQCLVEEAEFSQKVLSDALRLVAVFAHGCQSPDNWGPLLRGPFGSALFECAWKIYREGAMPKQAFMRNTIALFAGHQNQATMLTDNFSLEIKSSLTSGCPDSIGRSSAIICGLVWRESRNLPKDLIDCKILEECLGVKDLKIWDLVAWALALSQSRNSIDFRISPTKLDFMAERLFKDIKTREFGISAFALSTALVHVRGQWTPKLTESKKKTVLSLLDKNSANPAILNKNRPSEKIDGRSFQQAAWLLAYHSRSLLSNAELVALRPRSLPVSKRSDWDVILQDIGAPNASKSRRTATVRNSPPSTGK